MRPPLGVILAGGQARRMGGGDKGLLRVGDHTLMDLVISRIRPQVSELILNANGDKVRFRGLGLPVVGDSVTGFAGPLAGVLAGMDYGAAHGHDHVVTVAADTPFFPADLVARFERTLGEDTAPIVLAATPDAQRGAQRHPTFGLWPVSLRDDLRQALGGGVRKVVAWCQPHGVALAVFGNQVSDPFFNVNTPADLEQANALHTGMND